MEGLHETSTTPNLESDTCVLLVVSLIVGFVYEKNKQAGLLVNSQQTYAET